MTSSNLLIQLNADLTIQIEWAARVADFVQEWQRRLQAIEAHPEQDEEHLLYAASTVLSDVERLYDHTAQVIETLYRVSGQLPAPNDKLSVNSLELRVDDRKTLVSRPGGIEKVAIAYSFSIERYRYGAQKAEAGVNEPAIDSHAL